MLMYSLINNQIVNNHKTIELNLLVTIIEIKIEGPEYITQNKCIFILDNFGEIIFE